MPLPPNTLLNVHSFKAVEELVRANKYMISLGDAAKIIQTYLDYEKMRKTKKVRWFEVWSVPNEEGRKHKLKEDHYLPDYRDRAYAEDEKLKREMNHRRQDTQQYYTVIIRECWK